MTEHIQGSSQVHVIPRVNCTTNELHDVDHSIYTQLDDYSTSTVLVRVRIRAYEYTSAQQNDVETHSRINAVIGVASNGALEHVPPRLPTV